MVTNKVIQSTIQDLIQIKPQDFGKPSVEAIKDAINDKYSNKIVPGVGLCIALWDLLSTTEGLIGHGTGLVNVNGMHLESELQLFPNTRQLSSAWLSSVPSGERLSMGALRLQTQKA
jgi:hypothetical protein